MNASTTVPPSIHSLAPPVSQEDIQLAANAASFSLVQLEALDFPARQPLADQESARAFVFGHWKNFRMNFTFLSAAECAPFKMSLALLKRCDNLLGAEVLTEFGSDFEPFANRLRSHGISKAKNPGKPVFNFYLGLLRKRILRGEVF
jgi:hypothetical protein